MTTSPDFRTIYESEFTYVWQVLRRLGVRDADIEDVAHDVFVTVHRRLPDYDSVRPVRPWLFGISFRIASDYRQSARYRWEVPKDVADTPDGAPTVYDHLVARDAQRLVAEALDTLDTTVRAVFVMHDIEGHSIPEIVDSLDAPLNTLYSRLRIARRQFSVAVRRLQLRRGQRGEA